MQLGDTPLIKITGDKLQTILDDYEAGEPCVVSSAPGRGVSAHLQPSIECAHNSPLSLGCNSK